MKLAPMKSAAMIFAGLLALAIANAAESNTQAPSAKAPAKAAAPVKAAAFTLPKVVKKLLIDDLVKGSGALAASGKKLKVHYTGWLFDPGQPQGHGAQFDTSVGGAPFEFTLGVDRVIRGWQDGFDKMKVGGKRRLIIPAAMGYGERGAGDKIPPNSNLIFEVELMDVI
jgi:FKBP-type peptidyl-prolyl cis-trans isomerase FkpA